MEFITNLFSTSFLSAAGWTVIHSLWMGACVLAVVMMLQHVFAKNSPAKKYYLALGGQLVLLGLAMTTFYYYFIAVDVASMTEAFFTGNGAALESKASAITLQIKYLLAQNTPVIAGLWLLGVVLLLTKMAFGYRYVRKLRKNTWLLENDRIKEIEVSIRRHFNISLNFEIRTTKNYMTPILTGLFRPFIVLPLAVINSLEPEEVELILAHEIAHLKRYDHVAIFFQQIIETLLYFNPAIWVLSRQLNKFREEACDDMVVQAMGHEINYAKSLVKLQELHTTQTQGVFALSALGHKNQLLNRIKRIMKMENNNRNNLGRLAMVLLVPFALVLLSFYAKHEKKNKEVERLSHIETQVDFNDVSNLRTKLLTNLGWTYSSDTIPARSSKSRIIEKITKKENGREIEAEFENNELQYLTVDGDRLSPEEAEKYQDIVDDLKSELSNNQKGNYSDRNFRKFKFNDENGNEEDIELDLDFDELGEGMENLFEGLGDGMGDLFENLGEDMEGLFEDMEFIETEDGMIFKNGDAKIFEFRGGDNDLQIRINGQDLELNELLEDLDIDMENMFDNVQGFSLSLDDDEDGQIIIRRNGEEPLILNADEIESWADKFGEDAEEWGKKIEKNVEKWAEKYEHKAEKWAEKHEKEIEKWAEQMENRAGELEERRDAIQDRNEQYHDAKEERREAFQDRQERYDDAMQGRRNDADNAGRMTLQHRIEKELKRDGFMSGSDDYSFKLKGNRLKINGKKQPQSVYEKYKDIYERYTGGNLNDNTFSISNTGI